LTTSAPPLSATGPHVILISLFDNASATSLVGADGIIDRITIMMLALHDVLI